MFSLFSSGWLFVSLFILTFCLPLYLLSIILLSILLPFCSLSFLSCHFSMYFCLFLYGFGFICLLFFFISYLSVYASLSMYVFIYLPKGKSMNYFSLIFFPFFLFPVLLRPFSSFVLLFSSVSLSASLVSSLHPFINPSSIYLPTYCLIYV